MKFKTSSRSLLLKFAANSDQALTIVLTRHNVIKQQAIICNFSSFKIIFTARPFLYRHISVYIKLLCNVAIELFHL